MGGQDSPSLWRSEFTCFLYFFYINFCLLIASCRFPQRVHLVALSPHPLRLLAAVLRCVEGLIKPDLIVTGISHWRQHLMCIKGNFMFANKLFKMNPHRWHFHFITMKWRDKSIINVPYNIQRRGSPWTYEPWAGLPWDVTRLISYYQLVEQFC